MVAYGQGGTDVQPAHGIFSRQGLLEGPGRREGFGLRPELTSQFAQLQTLAYPVEQLYLELFLEPLLRETARSGLGHGQATGGTGDVLVPGGGDKTSSWRRLKRMIQSILIKQIYIIK